VHPLTLQAENINDTTGALHMYTHTGILCTCTHTTFVTKNLQAHTWTHINTQHIRTQTRTNTHTYKHELTCAHTRSHALTRTGPCYIHSHTHSHNDTHVSERKKMFFSTFCFRILFSFLPDFTYVGNTRETLRSIFQVK